MEFKKYNSIENWYQQSFVEKCIINLNWYNDFIVQEKIHWANFAFYVSENEIKCAKRTWFILEDEKFFNYKYVLENEWVRLHKLYEKLWTDYIIYWELFSWNVQKEVHYCDDQRFYAFDIVVNWEYLSVDDCNILFDELWFLYAKTLFRWTLEECFEYNINQNSILATNLWCTFEDWKNIMEWVVIKPNEAKFIWDSRIIFKNKTQLFSEKKAPDKISLYTWDFDKYDIYITKPRFDNIISKYWEISDKKDLPKYAGYLVSDIVDDANKDWLDIIKQHKSILFKRCIMFIMKNYF